MTSPCNGPGSGLSRAVHQSDESIYMPGIELLTRDTIMRVTLKWAAMSWLRILAQRILITLRRRKADEIET